METKTISAESPQMGSNNTDDSSFILNLEFNKEEFPELAIFESVKFKILADEKGFSPSLAEKTWEDLKLERQKDKDYYLLTFFSEEEQHTFKATPVFSETDSLKNRNRSDALIAGYEKLLSEKIITETQRQQLIDSLKKDLINKASAYNRETTFLDIQLSAAAENESKIQRFFQISKFGIYNSDMLAKMPSAKKINAQCLNRADSKKLIFPHLALIEKNNKAVYMYYPASLSSFGFDPVKKNAVLCAIDGGTLDYLSTEDFYSGYHRADTSVLILNHDTLIFKMKIVKINPDSKTISFNIKSLLKI